MSCPLALRFPWTISYCRSWSPSSPTCPGFQQWSLQLVFCHQVRRLSSLSWTWSRTPILYHSPRTSLELLFFHLPEPLLLHFSNNRLRSVLLWPMWFAQMMFDCVLPNIRHKLSLWSSLCSRSIKGELFFCPIVTNELSQCKPGHQLLFHWVSFHKVRLVLRISAHMCYSWSICTFRKGYLCKTFDSAALTGSTCCWFDTFGSVVLSPIWFRAVLLPVACLSLALVLYSIFCWVVCSSRLVHRWFPPPHTVQLLPTLQCVDSHRCCWLNWCVDMCRVHVVWVWTIPGI